jgi:nucleotide-binding universal stress UspA family protein
LIGENTKVTVGWFDPVMTEHLGGEDAGADISAKLSRHGCQVTLQQYPSGGKEIADGIKLRASELGADLIVMGAYGHAKLRERIFGGTTQSMLDQTKQTVLFAH